MNKITISVSERIAGIEAKKKSKRVYSEAEKARRREAERKRMEDPEYRARKRAVDRLRLQNKETRYRKRSIDRERERMPGVLEKKREAVKRFKATDRYKQWNDARNVINLANYRVSRIPDLIGKFCPVVPVKCICCGGVEIKKGRIVGASIVKSTYCKGCAKGKVIQRKVDIVCKDCGVLCQGNKARTICDTCVKAKAKERKRNDPKEAQRRRDHGTTLRSRARRAGVYVDTVSIIAVHKRDNWRCVNCGIMVVKSKRWQENQATIDHRIPLSRGGSHTYENCQTMCSMCNSKKEASIPNGVQLSVFDMVS